MKILGEGRFRCLGLLLVFAAACGDDGAPVVGPTGTVDDLLACDITAADCQQAIFASIAEHVGSSERNPPPVRTITPEEYEVELRAGLDSDDYTGAESSTRGLQLMGLIDEDAGSVIDEQIENLVNWVGAFYDPGPAAITIIDRAYADVDAQTLLAHEFVHAIQDRDLGFGEIFSGVQTEDALIATRSVVEGDAEHNSIGWAYDRLLMPLTVADWDSVHATQTDSLRSRVSDRAFDVLDFNANFPYVYGFAFMTNAILSEGLPVRAELWGAGPPNSLSFMWGYRAFLDGTVPARAIPPSVYTPQPGYTEVIQDELGAWTLYAFLHYYGVGMDLAWETALSSSGDAFSVFENDSDTVAVWRLRFAETQVSVADVVAEALALSTRSVAWTSFAEGSDVVIIAAESESVLEAWASTPIEAVPAALSTKSTPGRLVGLHPEGTFVSSVRGLGPLRP